jgi:DNA repair protein RadC
MATAQSRHNYGGHRSANSVFDHSAQVSPVLAASFDGLATGNGLDPYCKPVCSEITAGCLRDSAGNVGVFSIHNDPIGNDHGTSQSCTFDCVNEIKSVPFKHTILGYGTRLSTWAQSVLLHQKHNSDNSNEQTKSHLLRTSEEAIRYLMPGMVHRRVETFRVVFLDTHNSILADEIMWTGTINEVQVYPREVMRRAIELDSVALILAHNHPSQVHAPSAADIDMTKKLIASAGTLGLTVHDHFIISRRGFHSMRTHRSIHPWK